MAINGQNKKIKTKSGTEYVLQSIPVRSALQIRSSSRNGQNMNDEKFYEQILEHVVIDPKMTIDDFDTVTELEDLMEQATEFVYQGK